MTRPRAMPRPKPEVGGETGGESGMRGVLSGKGVLNYRVRYRDRERLRARARSWVHGCGDGHGYDGGMGSDVSTLLALTRAFSACTTLEQTLQAVVDHCVSLLET